MSPGSATRLLVSVRDPEEAALAVEAGASLIDAKDPEAGALGALPPAGIRAIVEAVGARAATSAVAGEAASVPDLLTRLPGVAGCGVEMVKVALPPRLMTQAALAEIKPALAAIRCPVVAVMFAEDGLDLGAIPVLAAAGWQGMMVDTRTKTNVRLPDLLALPRLRAFVAACDAAGLISGLAGSLRIADLPAFAPLGATYLGFRGGLCSAANRRGALDPERVREAARRLAALARAPEPA